VTDCDVKVKKREDGSIDSFDSKTQESIQRKQRYYNQEGIKTFVSPNWTFEYSVALSDLRYDLHRAILEADKVSNSNLYPLTPEKTAAIDADIAKDPNAKLNGHEYAHYLYQQKMLDGNMSKAVVAQCFAAELRKKFVVGPEFVGDEMFDVDLFRKRIDSEKRAELKTRIERDEKLLYIVDAIKYATGTEGT